jgi:Holliday junction DNA helicase RuvA
LWYNNNILSSENGDLMYSYLIGKIVQIRPSYIVLETNNIGYELIVSNPYSFELGADIKIYVFKRVREPDVFLYGFKTLELKDLFLKLINVPGIGPKSALSILASDNTSDLILAIEEGNAKFLTKFPGIGMKSAQQIILDLKGKLTLDNEGTPDQMEDVSLALTALGYSKAEIKKALKKVTPSDEVDKMVKQALQILLK